MPRQGEHTYMELNLGWSIVLPREYLSEENLLGTSEKYSVQERNCSNAQEGKFFGVLAGVVCLGGKLLHV